MDRKVKKKSWMNHLCMIGPYMKAVVCDDDYIGNPPHMETSVDMGRVRLADTSGSVSAPERSRPTASSVVKGMISPQASRAGSVSREARASKLHSPSPSIDSPRSMPGTASDFQVPGTPVRAQAYSLPLAGIQTLERRAAMESKAAEFGVRLKRFSRQVSNPKKEEEEELIDTKQIEESVESLQSHDTDKRKAVEKVRLLSKGSDQVRKALISAGVLQPLVALLSSSDTEIIQHAIIAIINMSNDKRQHDDIISAGAIPPLVNVLVSGHQPENEDAAEALFGLSMIDEHKPVVAQAGALNPLLGLLGTGTKRGRKYAAQAIFSLTLDPGIATEVVEAGALKKMVPLIEDSETGLEDQVVAILGNLAKVAEGCDQLAAEARVVPLLVELVEGGSGRAREDAAATLLLLCSHQKSLTEEAVREGVIPSLVALQREGRSRGRDKATSLLQLIRTSRGVEEGG